MSAKLSPSMQKAMNSLPLTYSLFGGKLMGSNFPATITLSTINALKTRGLVKIVSLGAFDKKVVRK